MIIAEVVYNEVTHVIRACYGCVTIVDVDVYHNGWDAALLTAELLDPGIHVLTRVERECNGNAMVGTTARLPRDAWAKRLTVRAAGHVISEGEGVALRVCEAKGPLMTVDLGGVVVEVHRDNLGWAGFTALTGSVYKWRTVRLTRLGERLLKLMLEEYRVYPSINQMLNTSRRGESAVVLDATGVHVDLLKHVAAFAYGMAAEGYAVLVVTNDVDRVRTALQGIGFEDGLLEGIGAVLVARKKPRVYVDTPRYAEKKAKRRPRL